MAWSFDAQIYRSKLSPMQKLVALAISSHCNTHGDMGAFPSVATLSAMTGAGRRTVQRSISDLADAGFIEIEPRHTENGQTSNLYRLVAGNITSEGVRHTDAPPAPHRRPPRATVAPKLSNEHSNRTISQSIVDGFEEFWSIYPRKVGKPAAAAKYRAALKKADHDEIIRGLNRYVQRRKDESSNPADFIKYTAHAATWLHQERWNDEDVSMPTGESW